MGTVNDTYTHGHHESVLRSHTWRTKENSAAHLVPLLRSTDSLLDIGCGPGNITLDLATLVPDGEVIGLDLAQEIVDQAETARLSAEVANVTFRVGDVYALDFDDDRFDVIHAHQVLQHLSEPVGALSEMRRVAKPGGIVAVRDADYPAFAWAPAEPLLDRWLDIYMGVTARNHARADAGRLLLGWTQQAGFTDITATSSTWTFAEPESRAWWGELWADRTLDSSLAAQAINYEIATKVELEQIAAAWRRWSSAPDGWFAVLHGEVVAVA